MIGPIIEDMARKYSGRAVIGKLNVDENPAVSQQFGIRSIPTILLFKNGRLADTIVGAAPREQIEARLNALLA
jgi:thioredoxin 1